MFICRAALPLKLPGLAGTFPMQHPFLIIWSLNNMGVLVSAKKHFTAEQAKEIGEKLGVKWDRFDVEQFRKGMDVELEHGTVDANTNVSDDDPLITGKIALAHLNEFPDYYTRLEKMEEEAEEQWKSRAIASEIRNIANTAPQVIGASGCIMIL